MKIAFLANKRAPLRRVIHYGSVLAVLFLATLARADIPSLAVTVSDAGGNLVFNGATDANATFATERLAPGDYVVQIKASDARVPRGEHYLLVASAGRKKVIADDVSGNMFSGAGVAMKVKVARRTSITGQVARSAAMSYRGNPKLKVIDGRLYRWVDAETGSNLGGHWVEGTLADARQIVRLNPNFLRKMQDYGGEGSMINRYRGMGQNTGYVYDGD